MLSIAPGYRVRSRLAIWLHDLSVQTWIFKDLPNTLIGSYSWFLATNIVVISHKLHAADYDFTNNVWFKLSCWPQLMPQNLSIITIINVVLWTIIGVKWALCKIVCMLRGAFTRCCLVFATTYLSYNGIFNRLCVMYIVIVVVVANVFRFDDWLHKTKWHLNCWAWFGIYYLLLDVHVLYNTVVWQSA